VKAIYVEVDIAMRGANFCMTHQLSELDVGYPAGVLRAEGVAARIQDELLTGPDRDPGSCAKPIHLLYEAVLGIGSSAVVQEDMVLRLVRLASQVAAQIRNGTRQRNDSRAWFPLLGYRFVDGYDPNRLIKVNPFPHQRPEFSRAAVRGKKLIRARNETGGSPERLFASSVRRWRRGATICLRLSFVSSTRASDKTASANLIHHAARA
jgi:hypothetical protein